MNNIEFRIDTMIGGINANSKLLINIIDMLNNNEFDKEYILKKITNENNTIISSLFDDHDGLIVTVELIKNGIYGDIGLLSKINNMNIKIDNYIKETDNIIPE